MRIVKESPTPVVVVECLHNRLDHRVSDRFKEEVWTATSGRTARLVIDLTQVEFMDSTALAALICLLKRMGGSGDVVICGMRRSLRTFLSLTHMDRVFRVFPDAESAVAKLAVVAA